MQVAFVGRPPAGGQPTAGPPGRGSIPQGHYSGRSSAGGVGGGNSWNSNAQGGGGGGGGDSYGRGPSTHGYNYGYGQSSGGSTSHMGGGGPTISRPPPVKVVCEEVEDPKGLFCPRCSCPMAVRVRMVPCFHVVCGCCQEETKGFNQCPVCHSSLQDFERLHPDDSLFPCREVSCDISYLNSLSRCIHSAVCHRDSKQLSSPQPPQLPEPHTSLESMAVPSDAPTTVAATNEFITENINAFPSPTSWDTPPPPGTEPPPASSALYRSPVPGTAPDPCKDNDMGSLVPTQTEVHTGSMAMETPNSRPWQLSNPSSDVTDSTWQTSPNVTSLGELLQQRPEEAEDDDLEDLL